MDTKELVDLFAGLFIEWDQIPEDKRGMIRNDQCLGAFDKDKKKYLLVRLGDLWTQEDQKKLKESQVLPLILKLLKI